MDNETELLFWMVGKSIDSPKVRKIDYKKMAISVKIDNFLYLAIRNRCIPIVYKYRELFGRDVCEKISKEFRRVQQKNMHLQEVANEIANAAIKDKIEIIEPKGVALTLAIYNNLESRQFGDLDFLTSIENMASLGRILVEHGFTHRHNGDIADICDVMKNNTESLAYEIKFMRAYSDGSRVVVELKKASDAISYTLLPQLLLNLKPVYMRGKYLYQTFSNEGLLLHLCSNIYTDHYRYEGVFSNVGRWRDFVDLYFFIKNVHININEFIDIVQKCQLENCVIFCKLMMWELFEIQIFEDVRFGSEKSKCYIKAQTIFNREKKKYFLGKFSNNQKVIDGNSFSAQKSYMFMHKSIEIKLNHLNLDEIGFRLIVSHENIDKILRDRRLYLCIIEGLDNHDNAKAEADINANTYYEKNQSICFYLTEEGYFYYQDNITLFSVNRATTENYRLAGQRIEASYKDSNNYIFDLVLYLPLEFIGKHLYFNAFTDLRLLKDYYKHDSYLYQLGSPFLRIK